MGTSGRCCQYVHSDTERFFVKWESAMLWVRAAHDHKPNPRPLHDPMFMQVHAWVLVDRKPWEDAGVEGT